MWRLGRMDDARELYEPALAIAREVGDRRFEGVWPSSLGRVTTASGALNEALDYFAAGEALLHAVGDKLEVERLDMVHRERCRDALVEPVLVLNSVRHMLARTITPLCDHS